MDVKGAGGVQFGAVLFCCHVGRVERSMALALLVAPLFQSGKDTAWVIVSVGACHVVEERWCFNRQFAKVLGLAFKALEFVHGLGPSNVQPRGGSATGNPCHSLINLPRQHRGR